MHQGYQNSGAAELAQLQATMQAIELACSSIQVKFISFDCFDKSVFNFKSSSSSLFGL